MEKMTLQDVEKYIANLREALEEAKESNDIYSTLWLKDTIEIYEKKKRMLQEAQQKAE